MALVLSEEQIMLKDAAKDFLSQRAPISHLRQLRDSGNADSFSRELWHEMAEMGWTGIPIPEAYGGLGYGYLGLGIILEESGRTLSPCPLISTVLLGASGINLGGSEAQKQSLLSEIASGELLLALAIDEQAKHQPENLSTTATAQAGGWVLNGQKCNVMDGHCADYFLVAAKIESENQTGLFLVKSDQTGLSRKTVTLMDSRHAALLTLDHIELEASARLGADQPGLLELLLDIGRIGIAAELLGIAQEAFERTLDYLKQRKQFGLAIGSFQALQHRAALAFGEIELSKSALIKALQAIDQADPKLAMYASLAKAKASQTAQLVCAEAVQMHGGIGMTDEFDIGFFMKRAKVLEQTLGNIHFHYDRFARLRGY